MAAQRTLKIKQRKQRNPERLLSRDTKKDVKRDTEKRGAVREHEKTQQYASVLDMSKQALELV